MKSCTVLAIVSLVAVCSAYAAGGPEPRRLEIAGSSTIQPVAELVGELYREQYGEQVRIIGGGSMAGLEGVLSGAADIGLVSRDLSVDEKERLGHATIGHDAVVIIVNSANTVKKIRRDTLAALYRGNVQNWKKLGGNDEPVLLISKLPGRSTLEIFEDYTGLSHPSRAEKGLSGHISRSAYEIGSNLESATLVGGMPGAIGYVSLGTALSLIDQGMPLNILTLEGIEGTRENVMSGAYPVKRDLNLVFRKDDRKVKRFIELFLGPGGQRILVNHGFIPEKGGRLHGSVGTQ